MTFNRLKNRWSMAGAIAALGVALVSFSGPAAAVDTGLTKTANGLTVYLGVVSAEIVKGPGPHSAEQPMHGRIPRGPHEYHVIAALFDAATGARVSDGTVTAQVSGLGLSGAKKTLEAMQIEGTTTYGGFFDLPGADLYTIKLHIERPVPIRPVDLEFKYDHRQ